jgi:hypothetical protein
MSKDVSSCDWSEIEGLKDEKEDWSRIDGLKDLKEDW